MQQSRFSSLRWCCNYKLTKGTDASVDQSRRSLHLCWVNVALSIRVSFVPTGITLKFEDRRKHRYGVIKASHGNDLNEPPIAEMFPSFFKVIAGQGVRCCYTR